MSARLLACAALAALTLAAAPARGATLRGTVVDRHGQAIEFANVRARAAGRGAVTDEQGAFTLVLPDSAYVLEVSQIGFQKTRLALAAGATGPLRIELADEPVPVAEVTVAASSFGKTGKSEGAVVRRMDVMMTPGGAADIFQSLRALPGISAPAEGAALYVRGGAPDETVIRIDGASIGHPYHYEGASGGLFSILDAYMLKSAFFSSGGFGARYGGAMSGVLDIETQDPLNLRTVSVGANLAGYSGSATWALVPDRLSALVSVQQSVPDLLFKLYGAAHDYAQVPWNENGVAKLLWRYSPTGRVSVFGIGSVEHLAVSANVLNVLGTYATNARNGFGAVHVQDVLFGRGALRANLTEQHYRTTWSYTSFSQHTAEHLTQGDVDLVWPLGTRHELSLGGRWQRERDDVAGDVPADSTNLGLGAPVRAQDTSAETREPGFYLEDKLRLAGPVYATLGARADRDGATARWHADPRVALAWRVDEHQTVRLAAGRYHQGASLALRDPRFGNPRLAPPYADHAIAGYEWKSDYGNVRLEAWQKRYHDLPLVDSLLWFRPAGTGRARGINAFVQGTWRRLNGWVSYGWLDARRRQMDDPTEVPAASGVAHSLTLVGQYHINLRWESGVRWTHTSGRPFTPVAGATWDDAAGIWHPVYGAHDSARLPAYDRLDVRLMRLFSLPKLAGLPASGTCVTYMEAMNVLGTVNVLDYAYSSGYVHREPIESYFSRRMLVMGCSLTW